MGTSESSGARRIAVLVAAGSIAAGGLAGGAVASETDSQDEGVVVPSPEPRAEDVDGSGEQTPGETALPEVVPESDAPAPGGGGDSDLSPVTPAPGTQAPDTQTPGPVPGGAPLPISGPSAPDTEGTPASPVVQPPDPAAAVPVSSSRGFAAGPLLLEDRSTGSIPHLVLKRAELAPAEREASRVEPVVAAAPVAARQAAGPRVARVVLRGTRVHVVRPGDSLWSIATRLLNQDANAAAVAHEVTRLWRLNATRIRTGDPDVLPVGVRLRLV